KEARIENARAEQEAKAAEYQRDAEIAESEKEKELKVAEYRRQQDIAKAEADQAYQLQEAKAKQKVTEERIQVDIVERQKQNARREKQYDAEVKKKADTDRYSVEQEAEAEKARELRAAEAHRFKIEQEGVAEAEAEKAKGFAAADVIREQGFAEAEAKTQIAKAFELYGKAAIMDMVLDMLPVYAKEIAQPLGNIDKITVVDTGSGEGQQGGAGKVSGYATDLMATIQETLKASSGIDVKELLESYAGKGNIKESIDQLAEYVKQSSEAKESEEKQETDPTQHEEKPEKEEAVEIDDEDKNKE